MIQIIVSPEEWERIRIDERFILVESITGKKLLLYGEYVVQADG